MRYSPRLYVPGLSVHIIRRGINREVIYRDDRDHLIFLHIFKRCARQHGLSIHGFVLMTTHYHALATPRDAYALPRTLKAIGQRYVRYFNRKYDRIGTLWTGRYRAIPVDSALYWLTCLRYIEQNPVRAKVVTAPEQYRWSSYRAHAFGESMGWLADHEVLHELGSEPNQRQAGYRSLCASALDEEQLVEQRYSEPVHLRSPLTEAASPRFVTTSAI